MSEYFERLDTNNYNTELDYLLENEVFKFSDYRQFYDNGKITKYEWERVKEYFLYDY